MKVSELIKGEKERHMSTFLLSLIFMVAFFTWIYVNYGVYYLSNDDTGMMKGYSGYGMGIPSPYHQYGSFTLGMIYKLLYTVVPTWNWYSYFSVITVIVSNSVILYVIYRQRDVRHNKFKYMDFILIALIVTAISLYGIATISWTINAAFAAVAGTMLLIHVSSQSAGIFCKTCIAGLFMIVSLLIRGASYKAVLPFALLAVCYRAGNRLRLEGKHNIKKIAVELAVLIITLITVMAYSRVDTAMKSGVYESGKDSFEYYRGLYTDYPHITYKGNEEFYDSIGWDEEFYNAVGSWMFIDPRFNTENLKKIAEASSSLRMEENLSEHVQSFWECFKAQTRGNIVRILMSIVVAVFFVMAVILAICVWIRKQDGWYDWLFLAGVQAVAIAEWVYLAEQGRFIDRAFYCAAFPALFIGVWMIAKHACIIDRHVTVSFAVGILAVYAFHISTAQNLSMEKSETAELRAQISHDADAIYAANPENFYIYDGSIISGTALFLDMSLRGCGRNSLMWGGTGVYSKTFYDKIAQFGYDEFYSDNLFDENVYYITTNADVWNSSFMTYMKKMYGKSIDAQVVQTSKSGVYVYKFRYCMEGWEKR